MLTRVEVLRFLAAKTGRHALMARLLYGRGLRLLECIRLRIQDVDFDQHLIFGRGEGGRDRTALLPWNMRDALQAQIEAVKARHHQDLARDIRQLQSSLARLQVCPLCRALGCEALPFHHSHVTFSADTRDLWEMLRHWSLLWYARQDRRRRVRESLR